MHLQASVPTPRTPDDSRSDVEAGVDLWLATPVGATRPSPLVLVQYDLKADPDRYCAALQQATSRAAFVLCQRVGSTAPQTDILELKRGVELTKRRFGRYLGSGSAVLIAVRQSLRQSERLVRQEPGFFSRVLMIGRDVDGWSASTSTLFAKRGGNRVLFASTAEESRERFEQRANLIRRAGARAEVAMFDAPMTDSTTARFIEQHWGWLTQGDPRFAAEHEQR